MRKYGAFTLIVVLASALSLVAIPVTRASGQAERGSPAQATAAPSSNDGDAPTIVGQWQLLPGLSHDAWKRYRFAVKRERSRAKSAAASGGDGDDDGDGGDGDGGDTDRSSRNAPRIGVLGGRAAWRKLPNDRTGIRGGGGSKSGDGGHGRGQLFARAGFTPQSVVIEREGTTFHIHEDDQSRSIDTESIRFDEPMGNGRWETSGNYRDGLLTVRSWINLGGNARFGYRLDAESGHLIMTLRLQPRTAAAHFTVRRVYERVEGAAEVPTSQAGEHAPARPSDQAGQDRPAERSAPANGDWRYTK